MFDNISKNEIKYYVSSFSYSIFNSINMILATNNSLYALNKHKNITKLYTYKDIIGQLSGLSIAYIIKNKETKKEKLIKEGYKVCILQQLSVSFEMVLRFYPTKYILFTGISNTVKNVSWILLGAINAQLIANVSKNSNKEIPEIYTNLSIFNTIGSTVGMYIGTKLINVNFKKQSIIISPLLFMGQLYNIKNMIN